MTGRYRLGADEILKVAQRAYEQKCGLRSGLAYPQLPG